MRHVQAGEVPWKVWRDLPEAEVAAVSSAVLNDAGRLLLGGHAAGRSHHDVTYGGQCQEESVTRGMHHFENLLKKRNRINLKPTRFFGGNLA